jgi:hypothetical protein
VKPAKIGSEKSQNGGKISDSFGPGQSNKNLAPSTRLEIGTNLENKKPTQMSFDSHENQG